MKNAKYIALILGAATLLGGCTNNMDPSTTLTTENPPITTPSETTTEQVTPSVTTPVETTPTPTTPEITTPTPTTPVDTNNYVETNEFLERITSSYSYDMTPKEDMGLSSTKDVGVNKELLENEVKFTCPTEGTVYLAEDYGITPTAENNAGNLSILLANIRSVEGNKIIKFKGETYPFGATVDVTSIEDLYLVGEEGTLFEYYGWGTYFEAKLSKNVNIYNITFDMIYSPTIAGTIKRVSDGNGQSTVTLSIPSEFDLSKEMYMNWSGATCSYMECFYDEVTGGYVPDTNANLFYNSPTSASNKGVLGVSYRESSRELDIILNHKFPYCAYKTPTIGKKVSFAYTMYENFGFYFLDCETVNFENVTVHVTGGMGFRVDRGKNFNLNRVRFSPKKGSERIMTCTADIIHTIALEGPLNITNCILESSHDDALNIKTFYTKITSVNASAREISVQQTQNECTIPFYVGDQIDIYNPATMGFVDSYTIKEIVKSGTAYTFTVDRRPNRNITDYNCGNATRITELNLNNTLIRNKRNRGILLQTRKSQIVNCTFQNVVMGAIQVLSVTDIFREAIVPQDIKIANCKFISNSDDISVFAYGSNGSNSSEANTIKNVEITNNLFYNTKGRAIWLLANGNTSIHHNLFYYPSKNNQVKVDIQSSCDIKFEYNVLYSPYYSGITFYQYSTSEDINIGNNTTKK